jgi:predicted NAD/FAD-binding protein
MRRGGDRMRIAVIGGGISGLVAAHLLDRDHEVTLFEAEARLGGHTRTVDVRLGERTHAVDTGFIVFNEKNYPAFCRLLRKLDVPWQGSDMSFGVRCDATGLEYRGSSLDTLFAQRRNLLRPSVYRLIRDVLRFYDRAGEVLEDPDPALTFGAYLEREGYSTDFVERHILPMSAALWSVSAGRVRDFPAMHIVRFFENHGMLRREDRPEWLVVRGGSRRYVEAIRRAFSGSVRAGTPIDCIRRDETGVTVTPRGEEPARFEEVVVACHADDALAMLEDPSPDERELLSAFPYERNEAVLHTDVSVLPRSRRAWASWNYYIPATERDRVSVTYRMNLLQSIDADAELCVTLNPVEEIDPERVLDRTTFHHPVYGARSPDAQAAHERVVRRNRTSFCGAYWGFGFHEDGTRSALAVAHAYGVRA